MPQIRAPLHIPKSWLLNIFQLTTEFIADLGPYSRAWHIAVLSEGLPNRRERTQASPWEVGLSASDICHQFRLRPLPTLTNSHGGTGKADGWGLHLWVLGCRGAIFSRPGLKRPGELADGGSLGRVHIELGPEEVLLFPLPRQCAAFLHHSQPDHSRRGRQKGHLAGLASERVPEALFPLELWVRIGPFRFFLKSSTPPPPRPDPLGSSRHLKILDVQG